MGPDIKTSGPEDAFRSQRKFINQILNLQRESPETSQFLEGQGLLLDQAFQGASGDISELPDDFRRNLEQDARSSQTARGVARTTPGAIQEAAVLAGGRENIRARRLGQLGGALGQFSLPLLGLAPNSSQIASISGQQFNQRAAQDAARGAAGGRLGSIAGGAIGTAFAPGVGTAAGASVGGAAGTFLGSSFG